MRPFGSKLATTGFFLLVLLVLAAVVAVGDVIYGNFTGLSSVRESARLFRSEATHLILNTSALLPDLEHRYEQLEAERANPRIVRTDAAGAIVGPHLVTEAEKTVLFLGGSTTESNEVDEPYRFAAVAQKLMREAGADVRTVNAGVRGNTTQDSLIAYLSRPGFRGADIVVLMHNINDRLWLAIFEDYSSQLPHSTPTSGNAVADTAAGLLGSIWDYVSYRSNLLFALRQRLTYFNPWTGEPRMDGVVSEATVDRAGERSIAGIPLFEQNLRTFAALVRAHGAVPVLMTQPLGISSEAQAAFNESIRGFALEDRILLIDLDRQLSGDRGWAFLNDGIHLNNEGSRAFGGHIAQALAPIFDTTIDPPSIDAGIVAMGNLLDNCAPPPVPQEDFTPGPPRRILGLPGRYPNFSTDGKWMLFQTWRRGLDRLNGLRVESGEIIELTPPDRTINERHPTFVSASDQELVVLFGSGFNPDEPGLEHLRIRRWPSGTTENPLKGPDLGGAIPAFRDGQIVFPGFGASGSTSVPDLMVLELGAESPIPLTRTPYEEWRPAIGPDGTIYFIANPHGDFDIMALPPGAGESEVVFRSEADEWDPSIDPSGRWLAFATKRSGSWDLALINLQSNQLVGLTEGIADDWDPSFHPGGDLLVFGRSTGGEPLIFGICPFGER
jgi:Tol biopolymer transport system component/lysophospholipase L1-like esterase